MNRKKLDQLEDLTRRYARSRPCAAGLGVFWVGALFEFYIGMVLGWVLKIMPDSLPLAAIPRFLANTRPPLPGWMRAATLLTPVLAWLGIWAIQQRVDRRFGRVEGLWPDSPHRWAGFAQKRFGPVLLTFMVFVYLWMGRITYPGDPLFATGAWGMAGLLFLAAWSWLWGRASRDCLTHGVMLTVCLPAVFLLGSNLDLLRMVLLLGIYAVLMAVYVVKGVRRYGQFLLVGQELAAVRPEAG